MTPTELFRAGIKYIELIALICCIILLYKRPNENKNKLLFWIMLIIVITDWGGFFARQLRLSPKVITLWYNILVPLQLSCWANLFVFSLKNKSWKKPYLAILLFYWLTSVCLSYILFFETSLDFKLGDFFTPIYVTGVILMTIICLRYLYEIVNSDAILQIKKLELVYISFGLLLFYLGTLPFNAMRNYLFINFPNFFHVYFIIFLILNYFLYSTISISVLWTKKK